MVLVRPRLPCLLLPPAMRSAIPAITAALGLTVALAAGPALANPVLSVSSDKDAGPGSLRAAVARANARPGPDRIEIEPGLEPIVLTSGQIDISDDLTISGPPQGQVLSGNHESRILAVTSERSELRIERLELTRARTSVDGIFSQCTPDWGQGGAICAQGNVTLIDSEISDNRTSGRSAFGAGLFVRGDLVMSGSVIRGNFTQGERAHGGGLYVMGQAQIEDSDIIENGAHGRFARGGGLYVRDRALVSRSTVSFNSAWHAQGVGIHAADDQLTFERSQRTGNQAMNHRPDDGDGASRRLPRRIAVVDGQRQADLSVSASASTGPLWPGTLESLRRQRPMAAAECGAIDFGLIGLGQTSDAMTITIESTGTIDLAIRATKLLSGHTSDFPISNNSCWDGENDKILPPGTQCSFQVRVSPTDLGERWANLNISSNAGNVQGSITLPLSALAVEPGLYLQPGSIDFGTVEVGDLGIAKTLTLVNSDSSGFQISGVDLEGDHPGDFTLTDDPCTGQTLEPGASCQVTLNASPTATGPRQAQLRVDSNAANDPPHRVDLSVEGIQASIELNPDSLEFGDFLIGQAGLKNLIVSNSGTADLEVTALDGLSAPFALAGGDCGALPLDLAPGAECTWQFEFTPAVTGLVSQAVSVISNAAPHSDSEFSLQGTGIEPGLSIDPESIDFGDLDVGTTSEPGIVTVKNSGSADLELGPLALSGSEANEFSLSETCSNQTLAPEASCSAEIKVTPADTGMRQAQLDVPSNAPDSPQVINLSANGIRAAISLSPDPVEFGPVAVGENADAQLTIANTGAAAFEVSAVGALDTPFSLTGGSCGAAPFIIEGGASCSLSLRFSPENSGETSQTLTLDHNAPDGDSTVTLRGTGTEPELALNSTEFDFGSVELDEFSERRLVVVNSGSGPLSINRIDGPAAPFSISGGSCLPAPRSLEPEGQCDILIRLSPAAFRGTAGNPVDGRIEIHSNAPSSPHVIELRGLVLAASKALPVNTLRVSGLLLLILLLAGFAWVAIVRAAH